VIILDVNIGFWHKTTHRLHLNPQNYLLQTDHLYKNITLVLKTPITDRFSRARSRPETYRGAADVN